MTEHATKGLVPSHPSAPRGPSHARSQLALARAPPSNFALSSHSHARRPQTSRAARPLLPWRARVGHVSHRAADAPHRSRPLQTLRRSSAARRAPCAGAPQPSARALRTIRAKAGAADARGPARPLLSRRAALVAARCSVRAVTAASVAVTASRRASAVVAVRASSTARRFRERAAARSGERTRLPVLPPSPPASARARLRAAAAVSIPASRSAVAAAACKRSFSLSLWLMSRTQIAHADAPPLIPRCFLLAVGSFEAPAGKPSDVGSSPESRPQPSWGASGNPAVLSPCLVPEKREQARGQGKPPSVRERSIDRSKRATKPRLKVQSVRETEAGGRQETPGQ